MRDEEGRAASHAQNCGVPYPTNDPNVDIDKIWGFTHEFQHAFDAAVGIGGSGDLIFGLVAVPPLR